MANKGKHWLTLPTRAYKKGNLKLTDQRTSNLPLGASNNIRFLQQVEVLSESSSPDTTSDVAAGIFYWGINAPDQVIKSCLW